MSEREEEALRDLMSRLSDLVVDAGELELVALQVSQGRWAPGFTDKIRELSRRLGDFHTYARGEFEDQVGKRIDEMRDRPRAPWVKKDKEDA